MENVANIVLIRLRRARAGAAVFGALGKKRASARAT
jgi:hypothetical protein